MKANHNGIRKKKFRNFWCFQQCKVTKMKANHNAQDADSSVLTGVSNNAKLLK